MAQTELSDRLEPAKRWTPEEMAKEVLKYKHYAMPFFYKRVGNIEEAQDMYGLLCEKVIKHAEKFKGESSVETWFYRISTNIVIDYYRSARFKNNRKKFYYEDEWKNKVQPLHHRINEPVAELGRQRLSQLIKEAYKTLSEKHQQVINLREFEGLSYQDIAEAVGCQLGTIMSRLHHGRKKMQRYLLRKGINPNVKLSDIA
jgi:RNA polymerase sigma-70 factor, ECF subfamily